MKTVDKREVDEIFLQPNFRRKNSDPRNLSDINS